MNYKIKSHAKGLSQSTARIIIAASMMLLFYCQMWGSSGQPLFSEGAQVYVMAHSGLTLREAPDAQSQQLGIIGYGMSVLVLNQPDSSVRYQKLDFVEGHWVYVEHDGVTGYMFDGYLSDLPLPAYDFEKCHLDMDLIYPLESWAEVNLGEEHSDTLTAGTLTKITTHFEAGDKLIRTRKNDEYKIDLYLRDIRVMDAYHLLLSMLDGKSSISAFQKISTFIEDQDDELYKVMIDADNPIWIRKLKNGEIKITIKTLNAFCGL